MAKPAFLLSGFCFACVFHSLLGWIGQASGLGGLGVTLYVTVAAIWLAALLLGDAIAPYLGLDEISYLGILGAWLIAGVLGLGALWVL
jgi:hypothetical protein